jgi:hypothetical protein
MTLRYFGGMTVAEVAAALGVRWVVPHVVARRIRRPELSRARESLASDR